MEQTRICTKCKEELPLSEFHKDKSQPHGYHYTCKKCRSEANRKYYSSSIGQIKNRSYKLLSRYNLTLEQYEQMLIDQNYKCAICGSTDNKSSQHNSFMVDHCHETGEVRGLLCNLCNSVLGKARDDVKILRKSIEYLEKYNALSVG